MAGDTRYVGSIPGLGRPQEKEIATHSRAVAWRIPWRESLAGYIVHWVAESPTLLK